MGGLFAQWQPQYADRGIATFPVRDKRPAVSNYLRMGLRASRKLAAKFSDADGFGFACGTRSGITVVDVDSPDERELAKALDCYGPTPVLVRSGSGNHQAWYRHSGERRSIRPDKARPVDVLGAGFVVAPPSRTPRGSYRLISGSLDDLAALPPIRPQEAPIAAPDTLRPASEKFERGRRNQSLWRECMKRCAQGYSGVEQLMGFAVKANQSMFYEPLPDEEVLKIVASAWGKERNGNNLFGRGRAVVMSHDRIDGLLKNDPDGFILLTILERYHWGRQFAVANAMAEIMPGGGWTVKRFSAVRRRLKESGEIELVRGRSKYGPATYRLKSGQK